MKKGFTLLELLLVVTMLSVVALLFVSYTGDIGNVSVDAASWRVQSDMRYAQQLATKTGLNHGVLFVNGGDYKVYSVNDTNIVSDPVEHTPMIENVSQFGDLAIGNNYRVEFDKVGTPVVGGGGNVTIVSASGASRSIYVVENTGAIIIDILGYGSGCSCALEK